MNKGLEKDLQKFQTFTVEEKKNLCLEILSWVKLKWGLFSELNNLVESWNATEQDYDDIYESAMIVLNDSEEASIQRSVWILEGIKEKMKLNQEQEKQDKKNEVASAEALLSVL